MKQTLSSAFNANAAVLYVIAAVVILYVLAQSIFFLVRAVKQSKKIGMDKGVIRRTARRSAIFSIAPAISIFIGGSRAETRDSFALASSVGHRKSCVRNVGCRNRRKVDESSVGQFFCVDDHRRTVRNNRNDNEYRLSSSAHTRCLFYEKVFVGNA